MHIADYVRASMQAWERITEHRSAVRYDGTVPPLSLDLAESQ
jgi:hypothetical protein